MKKTLQLLTLLFIIVAVQLSVTACNTMRGLGEDVEHVGGAIERKAEQKKTY